MPDNSNDKAIILFDGVCNLCNSSVNFIINHDTKNYFLFAPLQSEQGKELLCKFNPEDTQLESFVLIENNKIYLKSTAALRAAKHLNKLYSLLYFLIIVPPFIRNGIYGCIAKNRYKWFGKKEVCMIPNEEIKSRFIS